MANREGLFIFKSVIVCFLNHELCKLSEVINHGKKDQRIDLAEFVLMQKKHTSNIHNTIRWRPKISYYYSLFLEIEFSEHNAGNLDMQNNVVLVCTLRI